MRVLFWSETYWPHIGGAEVIGVQLVAALRQRGHTLAVVTQQDTLDQDSELELDGVPIYRFPFYYAMAVQGGMAQGGPGQTLALRRRIAALKRDFAPDLVYGHYLGPGIFFHLHTLASPPVPWTATLHHVPLERQLKPDSVLGRALRAADWVTACSEAVLTATREMIPEIAPKMSVIRNALDMPAAPPRPLPFNPPRLLCIGRVVPDKGFDVALAAFALLAPDYPAVRLVIAGDGEARPDLERQAAELNLGRAVEFVGYVPPEKVPELLNTATLVVVPSRWAEPFGLVALQAAQMARPVVATRVGGLASVVADGDTGILVENEDPGEMAEAIARLLNNPQTAVKMGEASRRRAQAQYGWVEHVDAYERLFQRLVQKAASRAGGASRG